MNYWKERLSYISEHINIDCDPNNCDYIWMRKGLIVADDDNGQKLSFVKENLKYAVLKAAGKVNEICIDDSWPLDSLGQCWEKLLDEANKVTTGLLFIHICDVKIFSHCWCLTQLAKQESSSLKFKGYVLLSVEGVPGENLPWSFAKMLAEEDNKCQYKAMMQFYSFVQICD